MASWQSRALKLGFRLQALSESFSEGVNVSRGRTEMELLAKRAPRPVNAHCSRCEIAGLRCEWIAPTVPLPSRTLLYIHGGGYFFGSINTHRALAADMANAVQAHTLIFEYRLAPEHRYPAALEDTLTVYRHLLHSGIDPAQLIVAGDSAGGGLTLALMVALREAGDPLPALAVCFSPWTDLAGTGESMVTRAKADPWFDPRQMPHAARLYLGDRDPTTLPLASPLYADLRGLPPLLIQVGMDEILLSDSTRLAEKAQAAGVDVTLQIWPQMMHVWQAFARFVPEGRDALDHVATFAQTHLSPPRLAADGLTTSYVRIGPKGQLQPIWVRCGSDCGSESESDSESNGETVGHQVVSNA